MNKTEAKGKISTCLGSNYCVNVFMSNGSRIRISNDYLYRGKRYWVERILDSRSIPTSYTMTLYRLVDLLLDPYYNLHVEVERVT